jgi:methylmalonyl-CoA mutase cobalamin-binding subunit
LRIRKTTRSAPPETAAVATDDDVSAVSVSSLSLHELFEQQARHMLERADLDEEQKQTILVALSCPCCGAGGMSFSVKLKPE